ncbi:MAG: D-glycero-beta-D-manno-heptose-7-phosphate kinase [Nitrospirae bacterium]|nr:MAG: D-glycero-beta-D-manno-heptose-7-phosphate kinase [Nitrospirota bacterium]
MHVRKLARYLDRFSRTRVLVIGDLILDQYIWGTVDRVSPEAPVPVVQVESESLRLGGAANVYRNVVALGGQADVCGVVGRDEAGEALLRELGLPRRGGNGIVVDASRPTTRKTRIVAHNQQIVRFDVEQRTPVPTHLERKILRYVASRLPDLSCVIVSDYAKGTITPSLMHQLRLMASMRNLPLVIDPKVDHLTYYHGATLITPNTAEATQAAIRLGIEQPSIEQLGHALRQKLDCQAVLITRGEHGMSLYDTSGATWHIPAVARQVYDVTGAGDTVVGTMALALSAGASLREAALLANQAASVVVGMIGTAYVTQAQLKDALRDAV